MKVKLIFGSCVLTVALAFSGLTYNVAASLDNVRGTSALNPTAETDETTGTEKKKEASQTFSATAYAIHGRTASGQRTRRGVIAADRRVLPLGTRVRIDTATGHAGEYIVADTGGAIKGRKIDIWVPSTSEAFRFGRRNIKLTVLSTPRAGKAKSKSKKVGY